MKVLIIQQKMIGDVLTSSILCENIKRENPNSTIHYMVHSHTIPVILNNNKIDAIINFKPIYRENKKELFKLIKKLNNEHYDVIIDVYGKIETNIISFLLNADKKIAYYKWYTKNIYTHPIKRNTEFNKEISNTIINRLQLLAPIYPENNIEDYITTPKIYLTDSEKEEGKLFLLKNNINLKVPIYMISILGSSPNKSYPLDYMAEVIDQIASQNRNAVILFNYIPKQLSEVNKIYELCNKSTQQQIKKEVYAPSLRNFLSILNYCTAIIGNEGGAINMAKALDIPSFAIFSPWIDKKEWATENSQIHQSVHLADYLPKLFLNDDLKKVKNDHSYFYKEFKPTFFLNELKKFITN
ncbi:glycosyltransferase family 9 protein [Joostella sp.]|uniref:glycosyltransferase family 9 protein n=1 Tax=Joostella sp. TaxID=2231138 RepID=UPI003A92D714